MREHRSRAGCEERTSRDPAADTWSSPRIPPLRRPLETAIYFPAGDRVAEVGSRVQFIVQLASHYPVQTQSAERTP